MPLSHANFVTMATFLAFYAFHPHEKYPHNRAVWGEWVILQLNGFIKRLFGEIGFLCFFKNRRRNFLIDMFGVTIIEFVPDKKDLMNHSFYLFALPSIPEGIGSVIDLAGSFHIYNKSRTPDEADKTALRNDWLAVGKDLQNSMRAVMEESLGKKE
jgi:hypothetical protein